MPNEFNYFDPDGPDDLEEYQPSPVFRTVALGLLAVMVLLSLFAIALLFV